MEEEIDLRPYIEALIENWKWIIGAAVVSAVVAFGISSVIPPTYEATALVAVTEPGDRVQFDPRFETVDESQPLNAYPELATSDEMLQTLLSQITEPLGNVTTVHGLSQIVEAESGSDPSLVRLTVSHGSAAEAARIANIWAELFVTRANEVYGDLGGGQVAFFENQLAKTETELEAAEQALIAFQARNRTNIIASELSSLRQDQTDNLTRRREIDFLAQDIEGLRGLLAGRESDVAVTYADRLTALLLQIKAYGILDSVTSTPLQLQIDPGESVASAQVAYLDDLIEILGDRSDQIAQHLTELEPRMLSLQERSQELEAESSRLTRDRNVADETYTALARKVQEEGITSQDTGSGVRLASGAAEPSRPIGARKGVYAASVGTLGGIASIFFTIVLKWWRTSDGSEASKS